MLYCSIGVFLKEIRKYKKMTLNQVVNSCHTGKGALSEFENGKRTPSPNSVRNLLNFYDVRYCTNIGKDIYSYLNDLKDDDLNHYINNYFFIVSFVEKNVYFLERASLDKEKKELLEDTNCLFNIETDGNFLDLNLKKIDSSSLKILLAKMYAAIDLDKDLETERKKSFYTLNSDEKEQCEKIKNEQIQVLLKQLNYSGLKKVMDYIMDINHNPKYKKRS